MAQPVLDYQGNKVVRGPLARRYIWAAGFGVASVGTMVLLYGCYVWWLVRPSTVQWLFNVLFVSVLATIFTGTRLRKPAIPARGRWLAVVAVCLALISCLGMLPLLGPARETILFQFQLANDVHLRKIAKACESYAIAHGLNPPHVAVLVADGSIAPEDLIDPFSRTAPAVLPAGLRAADWPKIVPLIDTHSDYVYTGAGVPLDAEAILLYDKACRERGGRLVWCFGGGSFVEDADLAREFAKDAAIRAARHLPAIAPP